MPGLCEGPANGAGNPMVLMMALGLALLPGIGPLLDRLWLATRRATGAAAKPAADLR